MRLRDDINIILEQIPTPPPKAAPAEPPLPPTGDTKKPLKEDTPALGSVLGKQRAVRRQERC